VLNSHERAEMPACCRLPAALFYAGMTADKLYTDIEAAVPDFS
jgi:hypothetical protein